MRARWPETRCCAANSNGVRIEILMRHVRRDKLREEVRNMRERMRRELSRARSGSGQFDIKQDPGGTADIEFLAQYWALLHAGTHPPVAMFADTIRQLESVASADLVPQPTVDVLTGAYRRYRERTHHRSLEGREPVVPGEEFRETRAAVTAIWNRRWMGIAADPYNPRRHASHQAAHPAQRAERIQGGRHRSAAVLPHAARCICGTRIRGSTCRSSRPAGRSARTAAPNTPSALPRTLNAAEAAAYV